MAYAWWYISSSCSPGVRKRPFRIWCCWFWLRSEHSQDATVRFLSYMSFTAVHMNVMDIAFISPQLQMCFPLFLLTVSHGSYIQSLWYHIGNNTAGSISGPFDMQCNTVKQELIENASLNPRVLFWKPCMCLQGEFSS